MRYLITHPENEPFITEWYDYENNYEKGMVIYDLVKFYFTTDGKTWKEINQDHL